MTSSFQHFVASCHQNVQPSFLFFQKWSGSSSFGVRARNWSCFLILFVSASTTRNHPLYMYVSIAVLYSFVNLLMYLFGLSFYAISRLPSSLDTFQCCLLLIWRFRLCFFSLPWTQVSLDRPWNTGLFVFLLFLLFGQKAMRSWRFSSKGALKTRSRWWDNLDTAETSITQWNWTQPKTFMNLLRRQPTNYFGHSYNKDRRQ